MAQRTTKLIQILQTGDAKAKVEAAYILGERKAYQAEDALLVALKDDSLEVKEWVAEALGKLKSVRAIEPLISLLRLDDYAIRTQVGWSLNKIGPEGLKALNNILSNAEDEMRIGAVTAIGNLRAEWAVESIIALLKDENATVRAAAGDALERIGDKRAIELLIQLMADANNIVRATAISTLANLGAKQIVPTILSILRNDTDWFVRFSSAKALGKLGDNEAIETLTQSLNDENEDVRVMAKISLGILKKCDNLGFRK